MKTAPSEALKCNWLLLLLMLTPSFNALAFDSKVTSRRSALGWLVSGGTGAAVGWCAQNRPSWADMPERFDVDDFLRTGMVATPMGVSGQAGKSKPETGVLLRDGSELSRDSRTGDVLAEILVAPSGSSGTKIPVLASFASPWPLATGSVFDVECRDPKTGDGVFLAVSKDTAGRRLGELKDSFFLNNLFSPTGRFSLYGQPTDVKVQASTTKGDSDKYKVIDVRFSTLSQSTQTEIPRVARIIATIPEGTAQAVMLVGSASALRWKRGSDELVATVADSFRAIPAPQTSLKVRAKTGRGGN